MAKDKKQKSKEREPKRSGGCFKSLVLMLLLLVIIYFGLHIYFIWQPAGTPAKFNSEVMKLEVADQKIFPAIQAFDLKKIAGRTEIQEGDSIKAPLVKARLKAAIDKGYPITFREEEINAWLNARLTVNQGGALSSQISARNVWVNFKQDEMEIILERELPKEQIHMVSLFMRFERAKNGFSISRHSSHIGQVRAPGGFARLVMPAFEKLAEELSEEMKLYKNSDGQLQIYDIKLEEGKITLDPRRADQRQ